MRHLVRVANIPAWVDASRLLGPGEWRFAQEAGAVAAETYLETEGAADLRARLRNTGIGGHALHVEVRPQVKRRHYRDALTRDARRRRDTTPGFTRRGARLDDEGRYSLTPEQLALQLGERLRGASVLDAGCGAGGNAIGFARAGCRVTAVERDEARLELARHNARVYEVGDAITFVRGDAVEIAAASKADVLFADPPWGRDWNRERVALADLPLLASLLDVFRDGGYGRLVAKVPPSFDPSEAGEAEVEAVFGSSEGDQRRVKYLLLVLPAPASPEN